VLQTELEDNCDKLVVDRRMQVVSTSLIDDRPVYDALSDRAKSITRFDDQYAEAKFFKSGV